MSGTRIGIVGTGNVGSALGRTLSKAGFEIRFAVRGGKDVSELLHACGPKARAADPATVAAESDILFLAVPGAAALQAVSGMGSIDGKTLVDCTNPVRWDGGPVWAPPPSGSNAAAIAEQNPKATVVKAFNTFGAEHHADPLLTGSAATVFMSSDSAEAKERLAGIIHQAGFAPIDAGPLRNAALLENMAVLWIHLATVGGQQREFLLNMVR